MVNVMLSLMNVMNPSHGLWLVQPIGAHCCEVLYFGCFGFRGELGFLKCDNICVCVENKQFEFLEFVFDSVNVDLQYDLDLSQFSCWVCGLVWCL